MNRAAPITIVALFLVGLALWRFGGGDPALELEEHAESSPNAAELEPTLVVPEAPGPERVAAVEESEPIPAVAPDTPSSPFGVITLHATWAETGEPATARSFSILQWGAPPAIRSRAAVTDAEGNARFDDVYPGRCSVEADVSGGWSATVNAGETHHLECELEAGFTARGRVVSDRDEPVAGAEIWLSDYFNYHEGTIVAHSAADGSFAIRGVSDARYIAARAAGHSPSFEHFLRDYQTVREGEPLPDVELTLELTGEGGSLRGWVYDASGAPVAGARLRFEGQRPNVAHTVDGRRLDKVAPHDAVSAGDGAYAMNGLPPGPGKLVVRYSPAAPYSVEVVIEAGRSTEHSVRLGAPGAVFGVVRSQSGEPEEDVSVHLDVEYDYRRPATKSRADGSFELSDLPTGDVTLVAVKKEVGKARATLALSVGAPLEWNPSLESGLVFKGLVVNEHHEPYTGWSVTAESSVYVNRRPWRKRVQTDASGEFRFLNVPSAPLTLFVTGDAMDFEATKVVQDIDPNTVGYVLTIRAAELPSASVTGEIFGPDGSPRSAKLILWREGMRSARNHENDPETGRFDIGPVPPDTYTFSIRAEGLPRLAFPAFELAAEERRDLGRIALAEPGRLRVTVDGAAEIPFARLTINSIDEAGERVSWIDSRQPDGGELENVELMPGDYRVKASGTGLVSTEATFRIFSNQETHVDLSAAKAPAGEPR